MLSCVEIVSNKGCAGIGVSSGSSGPTSNPHCRGLGNHPSGNFGFRGGRARVLSCDRAHASLPRRRSRPSLGTTVGRGSFGSRCCRVDRRIDERGQPATASRAAEDASDL